MAVLKQKQLMELSQDISDYINKEKRHQLIQSPAFMHGREG